MAADGYEGKFQLHPIALAHIDSLRDKRVAEVQREHFIENSKSEPIWRRVRNMMLKPNGNASNASLLLFAESGVGKTELLKFIVDKIAEEMKKAAEAGEDIWLTPPLHFMLDRCSTESLLVQRLSGGLYKGRRSREDVDELITLVESWNRTVASGLLLDELSDIGKGTPANQEMICQDLRVILNRYRRPLIATSNLVSAEIFAMDPNLATRFQTIQIAPWQADTALMGFLMQVFEFKCLKNPPSFRMEDWDGFLRWLVDRTGGITREIINVTNLAAVYAIDSGLECMCWDAYRNAGDL